MTGPIVPPETGPGGEGERARVTEGLAEQRGEDAPPGGTADGQGTPGDEEGTA